jgi:hypothetical protein
LARDDTRHRCHPTCGNQRDSKRPCARCRSPCGARSGAADGGLRAECLRPGEHGVFKAAGPDRVVGATVGVVGLVVVATATVVEMLPPPPLLSVVNRLRKALGGLVFESGTACSNGIRSHVAS